MRLTRVFVVLHAHEEGRNCTFPNKSPPTMLKVTPSAYGKRRQSTASAYSAAFFPGQASSTLSKSWSVLRSTT